MDESETVQDNCVEIMKAQQKEIERLQLPNFLDPAESAIAWATEYKAKQLAELKVVEMQPKVNAFDRVIDNSTTYTLDTVSDILNYGRTKLSEKLKDIGWAMKDSSKGTSSTRKSEESGYARTFFETVNRGEKEFKVKKIVVTKKGLDYLVNNFNELCPS
jgi:phage antirepressor YoqD-like protein